jgi:hypothetical protein
MGNNLLHCVCGHGHVDILPWLTARFAGELNEALNDENRSGNTPTLVAIKVTKYSQVFLLCENTIMLYGHFNGEVLL